ncbi:MAG: thiamine phosphate synthase [Abitibacteriaceae bacterium]|nr:thiamine phosphate synthase [Abditibacteriaceae bacterium]
MTLPRLLLITDRRKMRPTFEAALAAALHGGARLIQLREKDLSSSEILALARQAQRLCESYGAQLLINSRADLAYASGAAGVHLPEQDLSLQEVPLSLSSHALWGVSVHSVQAARRVMEAGTDYLVFGPVFRTASHPDTAPVGLDALRQITEATPLPVFAVGGIDVHSVQPCLEAGAHGLAVISAVWQTDDVAAATQALIARTEEFLKR